MKTIGISCRRSANSLCRSGPVMPGMAMSRIRHLVWPTQSDARNSSADANAWTAKPNSLSLTLADSGGVCECIFHSLPDDGWNFYTVSAGPRHERNLVAPNCAAHSSDRITEGQDRLWIPCGGSRLEVSWFGKSGGPERDNREQTGQDWGGAKDC